jgi:hypothetical protein
MGGDEISAQVLHLHFPSAAAPALAQRVEAE